MNVDSPAKKAAYSFRREWLKDFEWLRYENALCSMHGIHFKACGIEFAGNYNANLHILSSLAWLNT